MVVLPMLLTSSCSFLTNSVESFVSVNDPDAPIKLTEYNYKTSEKPKIKIKGLEEYDFKVSADEFYVSRTFKFSSAMLEEGNKFIENENHREQEKYLTLH